MRQLCKGRWKFANPLILFGFWDGCFGRKWGCFCAINLNQILVTFNKSVDKDTAENLANYKLEGKLSNGSSVNSTLDSSSFDSAKATLQPDGKTVLITIDNNNDGTLKTLANQLESKLTVSNVKTTDGQVIADTTKSFTYTDTTVPTVDSVKMEGNKVIVVKFSEFVNPSQATNVSYYQLDGVSLSAYGASNDTAKYDSVNNEVRIPLTNALSDKTYSLKVSVNNSITDAASYKVLETSKDLTVSTDTTVAKVTGVEVASDKSYVLVKFDKALDPTNYVTGNPLVIDGVNVFGSSTIGASIENGALKLVSKGVGTDFNQLISNGVHSVNVKNDDNNYLTDAYGVKVGTSSTTYSIDADLTKPTVSSVTVKSGATSTEVKFSEPVDTATAQNRFNYVLKNSKGETVNIDSAQLKAGSTDTVVLSHSALDAGNYTLTIQNVKDRAGNVIDAVTKNISVADTVAPTVSDVKYSTSNNAIYVYYSEPMNTATITDAANYKYDNADLPSGTEITALSNSAVKIKLPSSTAVAANKAFAVSNNTTDVAGNKLQGFGYSTTLTKTLSDDLALNSGSDQAVFVDQNTIQLTLNKELKSLDASDFQITYGSTTVHPLQQNVSFVNKDGKAVVTIKLADADKAGTDAKNSGNAYKVDVVALDSQKTKYGTVAVDDTTFGTNPFGASGVTVNDKIAPKLATTDPVQTIDSDNNGLIDKIAIHFTEALNPAYLSATTFAVSGYDVTGAALNGSDPSTVELTVTEKTSADTDATPTVQRLGTVKDVNGNEFTGLTSATASVDKAGPVLVSAKYTDEDTSNTVTAGDKVVLTFSENVQLKSGQTVADLADDFALSSSDSFGTNATFAVSGNKVTVTLGTSPTITVGTTTVDRTTTAGDVSLEDAAGNTFVDGTAVTINN